MKKLALATILSLSASFQPAGAQDGGTPPPSAPAKPTYEQQKQDEELRGLRLQNEKQEIDNRASRNLAIANALPASPTSGTITATDSPGKAEAAALAAAAVNGVADDIARATNAALRASAAEQGPQPSYPCQDLPSLAQSDADNAAAPPVLLLSGDTSLSFSHWEQFRFSACHLGEQFRKAIDAASRLPTPMKPGKGRRVSEAGGFGLPAIGAAATAVSKLLQWVTPDWGIAGITLSKSNRALMAAVARSYIAEHGSGAGQVYWQGQVSKSGASDEVFNALRTLDGLDRTAAGLEAKLKPDADKVKEKGDALALLTAARTAYDQLLSHLNGKEGDAVLPINQVIDEAAAARMLGRRGLALSLAVESADGGYYTRKVIWNAFAPNRIPFFVSASAVVSFAAIRPADQRVLAAGLFSCTADYVRITQVGTMTNSSAGLPCQPVPAQPSATADAKPPAASGGAVAGEARRK